MPLVVYAQTQEHLNLLDAVWAIWTLPEGKAFVIFAVGLVVLGRWGAPILRWLGSWWTVRADRAQASEERLQATIDRLVTERTSGLEREVGVLRDEVRACHADRGQARADAARFEERSDMLSKQLASATDQLTGALADLRVERQSRRALDERLEGLSAVQDHMRREAAGALPAG